MASFQINKKKNFKPYFYLLILIGIAVVFQGWNAGTLWGVSPEWRVVRGIAKSEVVQDDDDVLFGANKANVLFLLDVGSTMTFTPTGTLPDRQDKDWKVADAAKMLKDCTYGAGGLPLVGKSTYSRTRYGRDLDSSNNATYADMSLPLADFMEKHIDNYYFPFNTKDHSLDPLKSGSSGTEQPYALVLRDPAYWSSPRGLSSNAFSDVDKTLVPNDSRMYKMKLVMWRLLEDATLFESLRIGMATTFQEMGDPLLADFYKKPKYGATKAFPNGSGPGWATGLDSKVGYADSATARMGVMRSFYGYKKDTAQWAHINRAVLRVPIADYSASHRDTFRLWIDGYENANTSDKTPYYFENPELFADGKTYLSTALFPGHPQLSRERMRKTVLKGNPGIIFSSKNGGVTGSKMSDNTYNIFNKGSGEALGTILDFFSPPVNGANVSTAPASSFPIKDNCERNWVIVFTAGDDSQAGEYTAAQAALDLFKYTKNNRVTKLKDGSKEDNVFEDVQLDDGVRTIVVGFVDPANTALRKRLTAMAAAGDPVWNGSAWVADPTKKPYFANDVPELIDAMREILGRINTDLRPAKGAMTESSSLETAGGDGTFDLFAASYRVNNNDQWQGELSRYQSKIDDNRDLTVTQPPKWELGSALLNNRSPSSSGGRRLVYWDGSSFKRLSYSTGSGEYDANVAKLMGLRDEDLATPSKYRGKLHPTRALINWLHGFDYNYSKSRESERTFMLSDFGQSGVSMVVPPKADTMGLPGYAEWVGSSAASTRAIRLFAQSNEGILHVVNPTASGAALEDLAILPPPVMQPYRLASTKFTVKQAGNDKKADWNDSALSTLGSGYQSRPSYVLDGPLYLRDFDLDQSGSGWGTYLIGMLGRAGNGLYVMDVSKPDYPKFLWFRETMYQSDGRPVQISMGGGASEPTYTQDTGTDMGPGGPVFSNPNQYPFYQMGYNMPRPVAGVARLSDNSLRNFIALAGGFQEKLDLNNNGTVGAALYLLDPKNAYQTTVSAQRTKVFNSGSLSNASSQHRTGSMVVGADPYMGMLITPPAYLRSGREKGTAGKVFTADNRGNIFMVNFEDGFGSGASPLSENDWSIQTVGTLRSRNGESGADDNHCIPLGLMATTTSNATFAWIAGGTGNAGTRNNDNSNNNSAQIRNKGQYIFAFKASGGGALYRDDLMHLRGDGDVLAPDGNGWYIKLLGDGSNYGEEYVTTRPVLLGGKIYIATFAPKKAMSKCSGTIDGTARLYAIRLETGAGGWGGKHSGRAIAIRGVKIVGLTRSTKGKTETIIGSFAITNKADAEKDLNAADRDKHINLEKNGNPLFTTGEVGTGEVPFPPLSTYINYWRELK